MNYNFKIMSSAYENGISTVAINTENGVFIGRARLNPEDAKNGFGSELIGGHVAYGRATIKYLRSKIRTLNARKHALKEYYAIVSGLRTFNENDYKIKKLFSLYADYDTKIKHYNERIASVEDGINNYIKGHLKIAEVAAGK